jgi:hypothetical protein
LYMGEPGYGLSLGIVPSLFILRTLPSRLVVS